MNPKLIRSALAMLVFFSSIFAVAPKAFCFMKAEKPMCCRHMAHPMKSCERKGSSCPVCTFDNHNSSSIAPSSGAASLTPEYFFLSIGLPAFDALQTFFFDRTPFFVDSGPPKFLKHSVFRV